MVWEQLLETIGFFAPGTPVDPPLAPTVRGQGSWDLRTKGICLGVVVPADHKRGPLHLKEGCNTFLSLPDLKVLRTSGFNFEPWFTGE